MVPPREPVAMPVKETPPRREKRELIEEIKSFGQPTAQLYGADETGPNGAARARPAGVSLPVGPQEVGLSRPQGPGPLPNGGVAERSAERSASPRVNGRAVAEPAREATGAVLRGEARPADRHGAPEADPLPTTAMTDVKPATERSVEAKVSEPNPSAEASPVQLAVARPGDVREGTAAARSTQETGTHPEPGRDLIKGRETPALALVTKLATQLADTEKRLGSLQSDYDRLRRVVEERLGDLEDRITLAEAKSAVEAAQMAAATSRQGSDAAAPLAIAPLPPASSGGPAPAEAKSRIIKAKLEDDGGKGVARSPVRYRVQAASPHLAMLAEIERSGDHGAQIEVAVGDEVTGYGRVSKIVQRGTAWVVETDRGTIQ
jgi:hypothetical protein